ncbi:MAG: hypothetical protein ACI9TB_002912, partial [Parasphingorhabdus sp.]
HMVHMKLASCAVRTGAGAKYEFQVSVGAP